MATGMKRGVVVGASTALGKEIAERLTQSSAAAWDISLVDPKADGQVTSAGDEALVIAPLESTSFGGADVVFFAGDAETTESNWKHAVAANAAVVDATQAIAGEPNVLVYGPSFATARPDLTTQAMVPVRPASWLLASLARAAGSTRMMATVLLPASQFGDAAMDELHAQTVALLSFQNQPREVFDAQVAFSLRDRFGEEAKVNLEREKQGIEQETATMLGSGSIWTAVLAAPVFHGLMVSAWMDTERSIEAVGDALRETGFDVVTDSSADVTNQAVTEADTPLVRLRQEQGGLWVWAALDNVRWTAIASESCALAMLALRPATPLQ